MSDKQISVKDSIRRYLVYIGPMIGLTGLSLAIYFHIQSVQERVPTYYVSPQRAVIVNETGPTPSELQVLHHGVPVKANSIAALTLYFWNDGKLPIRRADVLEPLYISLPVNAEILEARVLKVSRPVVKFEKSDPAATSKNTLPISFDILEQSDGAAIQITFAGDPDAAVNMNGVVVGVGAVRFMSSKSAEKFYKRDPKESFKNEKKGVWALSGFGIVFMVGGVLSWFFRKKREENRRWIMTPTFLLLAGVLYCALGAYLLHDLNRAFSPGVPSSIWMDK